MNQARLLPLSNPVVTQMGWRLPLAERSVRAWPPATPKTFTRHLPACMPTRLRPWRPGAVAKRWIRWPCISRKYKTA